MFFTTTQNFFFWKLTQSQEPLTVHADQEHVLVGVHDGVPVCDGQATLAHGSCVSIIIVFVLFHVNSDNSNIYIFFLTND